MYAKLAAARCESPEACKGRLRLWSGALHDAEISALCSLALVSCCRWLARNNAELFQVEQLGVTVVQTVDRAAKVEALADE